MLVNRASPPPENFPQKSPPGGREGEQNSGGGGVPKILPPGAQCRAQKFRGAGGKIGLQPVGNPRGGENGQNPPTYQRLQTPSNLDFLQNWPAHPSAV